MQIFLGDDETSLYVLRETRGPVLVLRPDQPPAEQWQLPQTVDELMTAGDAEAEAGDAEAEAYNDMLLDLKEQLEQSDLSQEAFTTVCSVLDDLCL